MKNSVAGVTVGIALAGFSLLSATGCQYIFPEPCSGGPMPPKANSAYAGHYKGTYTVEDTAKSELYLDLRVDNDGQISGQVTDASKGTSVPVSGTAYDEDEGCGAPELVIKVTFTFPGGRLRHVYAARGSEGAFSKPFGAAYVEDKRADVLNKGELSLTTQGS